MKSVFVLQHQYEQWGHDCVKFIGVYSTHQEAKKAVKRLRLQAGFCDWPEGFCIDEYPMDRDHWTEGFTKVMPVLLQVLGHEPVIWRVSHAAWMPGDLYQIFDVSETQENQHEQLAFGKGQIVRCEEREVDGNSGCLVAVESVDVPNQILS